MLIEPSKQSSSISRSCNVVMVVGDGDGDNDGGGDGDGDGDGNGDGDGDGDGYKPPCRSEGRRHLHRKCEKFARMLVCKQA